MPEEKERGLMHWYDRGNSVDRKVFSAFMSVEEHDGELVGVVTANVHGQLTEDDGDHLERGGTSQPGRQEQHHKHAEEGDEVSALSVRWQRQEQQRTEDSHHDKVHQRHAGTAQTVRNHAAQ